MAMSHAVESDRPQSSPYKISPFVAILGQERMKPALLLNALLFSDRQPVLFMREK